MISDKTDEWDHEHAKRRVIIQNRRGGFKCVDKTPPTKSELDRQEAAAELYRRCNEQPRDKADRAWKRILASDELTMARSKLSIHEMRLIIQACIDATDRSGQ